MSFYLSYIYIYIYILLADFFSTFCSQLNGLLFTLLHVSRPGPYGLTSPAQGEQPQVVTKPVVALCPSVIAHPFVIVRPPPAIARSLIAANQRRVVSGGPARPSQDLSLSTPMFARENNLLKKVSRGKGSGLPMKIILSVVLKNKV